MSKVKIQGNASGTGVFTIEAPGTNDPRTLILPDAAGTLLTSNGDGSSLTGITSKVVQVVNVMDGAVGTGTTVTVDDDSIPQNTEGDEYMTLAITPTSATNKLKIDVVFWGGSSAAGPMQVALFQDTTANALAAVTTYENIGTGKQTTGFTHYMTAGTTSSTTFKVRAGNSSVGTTTFNGAGTNRKLGGIAASSITITEIAV